MSKVPNATAYGHQHGEAFMLMNYRCEKCGEPEIIWNSRDGVTPFMAGPCRTCGASMQHVNWGNDVYAPDHVPALGDRMWVDMTEDRAKAAAERNAQRYWDSYPPARDQFASPEEMATMLAREYFSPGAPDLIVVAG